MEFGLISRLEAAGKGGRPFDFQISRALRGLPGEHKTWFTAHNRVHFNDGSVEDISGVPHYTTSIDAALTLLAPKTFWGVEGPQSDGLYEAEISAGSWQSIERAAAPALALCIAALKANENE